jgi:hypothetical protein
MVGERAVLQAFHRTPLIFQLNTVKTPAMTVTMVRAAAVIIAPGAGSVQNVTAHNRPVSAAQANPSIYVVNSIAFRW